MLEKLHLTGKDLIGLAILILGFAMHWQAVNSRVQALETAIYGPPTLNSRVDKLEQSLDDIKDSVHAIRDAVGVR